MDHILVEYSALKSEQANRLLLRDAALHINIILSLTAIGMLVDGFDRDLMWQVVVLINLIMYWIYMINDEFVNAIRSYVKNLREGLNKIDDTAVDAFGWESYYRQNRNWNWVRRFVSFAVQFAVFFLVGLITLVVPTCMKLINLSLTGLDYWTITVMLAWVAMMVKFIVGTFQGT